MSLEDLDPGFKSDESDYEAENSEDDDDDEEECSYGQLLFILYYNLGCFRHIYANNAIIDMENDASSSSDTEAGLSELEFIHDHLDLLEDDYVGDFLQLYEEITAMSLSTPSSSQSSSSYTNSSVSSDVPDG
ncbi:hypothetical protein D9C73_014390 [Collichthys lucidus]|uniref:Uncharacterized protein n=1 Tax=Collichthys lucidus TaxID=240159 RepID=A0A4U5UXE6_COLLU|nr:hypothetical protein D9C73_014390 [Collichthys lucidus]